MFNLVLHSGSNIGNREENLSRCIALLDIHIGKLVKASPVYATEAWGFKDQPEFLNQALLYKTGKSPMEVLNILKKIECVIGKEKEFFWGPRRIDIDIIFYGDQIINTVNLESKMEKRRFVLQPLNDIVPNFLHPTLSKSISSLLDECDDSLYVFLAKETQLL